MAASSQSHIQNFEHRKKDLVERHLRVSAELIEANDNFEVADRHIKEVGQELKSGQEQKQSDSERLGEIRTELEAQRLVMSEKEAVRLTLHEKLNQAQSRLHSIEEIADRYERSPEGVRAVMQKAAPKEGEADENVYGLVADLLDVPKELELPVEAALTRKLQAVVVNDSPTALGYARYLQQENEGRADFLRASKPHPTHVRPARTVQGVGNPAFGRGQESATVRRVGSLDFGAYPSRAGCGHRPGPLGRGHGPWRHFGHAQGKSVP